ncbi:MAG: hypothetical protein CM15mP58_08170 [Burkholderiaceae bacterium]|nr:MAG: hypothetical protein CM15mP58_08170 [Burkholderiaceae bacterium]
MADANKNLNEAFDLIKAALTFAPQDPHIIDSMGWVYFRLGQLEMAEEWLEKAFNRQPDAEISAHYWGGIVESFEKRRCNTNLENGFQ